MVFVKSKGQTLAKPNSYTVDVTYCKFLLINIVGTRFIFV